jgi:hypothetical protein
VTGGAWTRRLVEYLIGNYADLDLGTAAKVELGGAPYWFDGTLPFVPGFGRPGDVKAVRRKMAELKHARVHASQGEEIERTSAWALYLAQQAEAASALDRKRAARISAERVRRSRSARGAEGAS